LGFRVRVRVKNRVRVCFFTVCKPYAVPDISRVRVRARVRVRFTVRASVMV
jgi:hypothetical protein